MEEVRGAGRCPFWPHNDLETKGKGKNIRSSWANTFKMNPDTGKRFVKETIPDRLTHSILAKEGITRAIF
jgi:hypothetical protein